jgi:hypothetical protein
MTSNYKINSGTDLDSLFLINNQNAGAIGFTISDGTDLGNRYSNATPKLNQTTGFQNNAGTDLGYLRSNQAPASTGNLSLIVDFDPDTGDDYVVISSRCNVAGGGTDAYVKNECFIDSVAIGACESRRVLEMPHSIALEYLWVYTNTKVSDLRINNASYSYIGETTPEYYYTATYPHTYYYRTTSTDTVALQYGYGQSAPVSVSVSFVK